VSGPCDHHCISPESKPTSIKRALLITLKHRTPGADMVRTQRHVRVLHTLMEASREPVMTQGMWTTRHVITSVCPLSVSTLRPVPVSMTCKSMSAAQKSVLRSQHKALTLMPSLVCARIVSCSVRRFQRKTSPDRLPLTARSPARCRARILDVCPPRVAILCALVPGF
jgi:hypothetical protein